MVGLVRTQMFQKKNVYSQYCHRVKFSDTTFHSAVFYLKVKEKERVLLLEKETGAADAFRRQRMIGCLPSIFNTILLAYRSMNRSVMTKQEIIHKIIANSTKFVDRGTYQITCTIFSNSHHLQCFTVK
jgi:DNA replication factor Cdt1 C-terminal domain